MDGHKHFAFVPTTTRLLAQSFYARKNYLNFLIHLKIVHVSVVGMNYSDNSNGRCNDDMTSFQLPVEASVEQKLSKKSMKRQKKKTNETNESENKICRKCRSSCSVGKSTYFFWPPFLFVMFLFHVQFMFLNKIIFSLLLLLLRIIPEQC